MLRLTRSECHQVATMLQGYLDGELEAPSARRVAEHLDLCRRCGLEASTYLAIKAAIAGSGTTGTAGPAGPEGTVVDEEAIGRLRSFAADLSGPHR